MAEELGHYLDLLSEAFILESENVRLNRDVQTVAAKHLEGLWILDGLLNCLNSILNDEFDGMYSEIFYRN